MLENSYSMKIVYVKKKIAGASRRFLAIFLIVWSLFLEGHSNLPSMDLKSTWMCRRILHEGVNHQLFPRATSKIKIDMCSL